MTILGAALAALLLGTSGLSGAVTATLGAGPASTASDGSLVTTTTPDRLVILFSHHGLRSLTNPLQDPNPDDPGSNDLPRILADQVEALLHRFPNVIAWVNGHTPKCLLPPMFSL